MSIFTTQGTPCTIVADCGTHQPKGFKAPARLVKIKCTGDDDQTYQRYEFFVGLKADGGLKEIEQAADAAKKVTLKPKALSKAIHEAL